MKSKNLNGWREYMEDHETMYKSLIGMVNRRTKIKRTYKYY